MRRADIMLGSVYCVKVSGKLAPVKITSDVSGDPYSMTRKTVRKFYGLNLRTKRVIGPFTAAKCRWEVVQPQAHGPWMRKVSK